jgi:plasmid stability protein
MEAEIREILVEAVSGPDESNGLFVTLLDRFGGVGGVELDLPARTTPVRSADLSA